jgi:hypothetical protein
MILEHVRLYKMSTNRNLKMYPMVIDEVTTRGNCHKYRVGDGTGDWKEARLASDECEIQDVGTLGRSNGE